MFFRIPSLIIFPFVDSKHIFKLLPTVTIKVDDCLFKCRNKSLDFCILFPTYEMKLKQIFESVREGVFIDVGSHVGKYTISVAKRLGRNGKVIAIEPDYSNFQTLLRNIELNRLENIIPLNVACSSKKGKIKFYPSNKDGVFSSFVKTSEKYVEIKSITLNRLLEELKIKPANVKLIKIDVEGSEFLVFLGGGKLFKKGNPRVVFECENILNLNKCKKFLNSYIIRKIDDRNFLAYKPSF